MENNGDRAIFSITTYTAGSKSFTEGLTKREHFAGMAMQAIISASNIDGAVSYEDSTVAMNAIKMADELLKQLESKP